MSSSPVDRRAELPSIAVREVLSDDGTRLAAWTNDPEGRIEGPAVVLCNGLGTNAWAWPALLDPDCGVRVISWNHRGTGGSGRPADRSRVGVDAFVGDALSVMDHFGVDRGVLVGWSMGVNVMFELAADHPERVDGLFAVAGVPGDTFSTMLGPFHLPRPVARILTVGMARWLKLTGRAISPLSTRLPVRPWLVSALSRTGFMASVPHPDVAALAIREFLTTPVEWYMHLALGTSRHARVSLRRIAVPTAFVAGRYDVLAGARAMRSAAARIDGATYTELRGTHFLPLEQPAEVHRMLMDFLERVEAER